jgi:transcriptional regulator with XRE-family HTH domain
MSQLMRRWPPDRISFHLGDAIRKARELRDWNQSDLAERARVDVGAIVRVEKNRGRAGTIKKVIAALGIDRQILEDAVTDRAGPKFDRKLGKMKELMQSMLDTIDEIDPATKSDRASGE